MLFMIFFHFDEMLTTTLMTTKTKNRFRPKSFLGGEASMKASVLEKEKQQQQMASIKNGSSTIVSSVSVFFSLPFSLTSVSTSTKIRIRFHLNNFWMKDEGKGNFCWTQRTEMNIRSINNLRFSKLKQSKTFFYLFFLMNNNQKVDRC